MKKFKNIPLNSKAVILIPVILILFFIVQKSKKQISLGAGRKKKISQEKSREAFGILEQIHSALVDKSKLSFIETAWFNGISNLLNS